MVTFADPSEAELASVVTSPRASIQRLRRSSFGRERLRPNKPLMAKWRRRLLRLHRAPAPTEASFPYRPALVFEEPILRACRSHIVYMLTSATWVLYVGRSTSGLHRPFLPTHAGMALPKADRWTPLQLYVWTFPDEQAATVFEAELLLGLCPERNTVGVPEEMQTPPTEPGWEDSLWSGPHVHACQLGPPHLCADRDCKWGEYWPCPWCATAGDPGRGGRP